MAMLVVMATAYVLITTSEYKWLRFPVKNDGSFALY